MMIPVGKKMLTADRTDSVHTENKLSLRETVSLLLSWFFPYFLPAIFLHGLFLGGLNSWLTQYVSVTLHGKLGSIALSFLFGGVLFYGFCFRSPEFLQGNTSRGRAS